MNNLTYKNLSRSTKTFYGVTFQPGEIKEVPGFINHPRFVRVDDEQPVVKPAKSSSTNSKETTKSTDAKKSGDNTPDKQGGKS